MKYVSNYDVVESARIQSFSGPYFPAFGVNTDQKKLRIRTLFTQCIWALGLLFVKVSRKTKYFENLPTQGFWKRFAEMFW